VPRAYVVEAELGQAREQIALNREQQPRGQDPDIGVLSFALVSSHRWQVVQYLDYLVIYYRFEWRPAVPTIELTRFRVKPDQVATLLATRSQMLADFRADRTGFLDAQLVRLPDDEWLDVVRWRSPEDFAASREKGANRPGIKAFFAAIDELVSMEEGELADSPRES
jgi:quinol monooxygenase YgiN